MTINESNYYKKVVINTPIIKMMDLKSLKTVTSEEKKMKIMKVIPMTSNMKTNNSNTRWRFLEIASLIRTVALESTLS